MTVLVEDIWYGQIRGEQIKPFFWPRFYIVVLGMFFYSGLIYFFHILCGLLFPFSIWIYFSFYFWTFFTFSILTFISLVFFDFFPFHVLFFLFIPSRSIILHFLLFFRKKHNNSVFFFQNMHAGLTAKCSLSENFNCFGYKFNFKTFFILSNFRPLDVQTFTRKCLHRKRSQFTRRVRG